jgi:two-component system, chemotaxis family, protein-glutamate methylesterase/glutaminase
VVTPPKRVLVVDDAVVVRRILTDVITSEPGLAVAGTAPNGRIGLSKIPQLNPDLVTLDIEMPEMDGLATLKAIRAEYPRLPVIMFSTLTERGAGVTLEALMSGANEYVTKPANVGSVAEGIAAVRDQLVPKIRALTGMDVPAPRTQLARPVRGQAPADGPAARMDVLVIGVSTGGPNALASFFSQIPEDFPIPVAVVQHMPPTFTRLLAERLDATSPLAFAEAEAGAPLVPGRAWIAPGDHHIELRSSGGRVTIATHQAPPENSCRPAVDVLFRSAAALYGPSTLGLVLTGMGQDGLRGAEHIRSVGGTVVAQDEATSVVWGMPGAVARAGLADRVIPLPQLPAAIAARVRIGRPAPAGAGAGGYRR